MEDLSVLLHIMNPKTAVTIQTYYVLVWFFSLNPLNLDPRLPEDSGSEPGRQDELRWGQAAAPDDQHWPEWAVCPLFIQGQGLQ